MKTSCGKFLNLAHYFPYDVKLRLLAHSRSFLANQKARNAIVRAENLLKIYLASLSVELCLVQKTKEIESPNMGLEPMTLRLRMSDALPTELNGRLLQTTGQMMDLASDTSSHQVIDVIVKMKPRGVIDF